MAAEFRPPAPIPPSDGGNSPERPSATPQGIPAVDPRGLGAQLGDTSATPLTPNPEQSASSSQPSTEIAKRNDSGPLEGEIVERKKDTPQVSNREDFEDHRHSDLPDKVRDIDLDGAGKKIVRATTERFDEVTKHPSIDGEATDTEHEITTDDQTKTDAKAFLDEGLDEGEAPKPPRRDIPAKKPDPRKPITVNVDQERVRTTIIAPGETTLPPGQWRLLPSDRDSSITIGSATITPLQRSGVDLIRHTRGGSSHIYEDVYEPYKPIRLGDQSNPNNELKFYDPGIAPQQVAIIPTAEGFLVRAENTPSPTRVTVSSEVRQTPSTEMSNLTYMNERMRTFLKAADESLGGSSGSVKIGDQSFTTAGLNFYVNNQTGEIVTFTIAVPPLLEQNPIFSRCAFRAIADLASGNFSLQIVTTEGTKGLSHTARQVLRNTVTIWNREHTQ